MNYFLLAIIVSFICPYLSSTGQFFFHFFPTVKN